MTTLQAEAATVVELVGDVVNKNFLGALMAALTLGQDLKQNVDDLIARYPAQAHELMVVATWIASRFPTPPPQHQLNPDAVALQGVLAATNAPGA